MHLSEENLVSVLSTANESERSAVQNEAEAQLKQWEVQSGFYYSLQSVYLNTDLALQVRWLAIICFKNGIDKHWRPTRLHAIAKDEKQRIKARLFLLMNEKNNQLSVQNAHSIARIVRFEFPADWPDLFDEIHKSLEEFVFVKNDLTSTNNLLIVLNHIIKTLSAVRIGRSRHAMQSKSPIIIPLLVKLYNKFFQSWTTSLDLGIMEICYLVLKNLRRLIPESYEEIHKHHEVSDFLKVSVGHLEMLISQHDRYSSDLIERYAKCYSKLYFNIININPTTFILMPCSNDIVTFFFNYLNSDAEKIYKGTEDDNFWETIALKGFLILKKLITYIFKKGAITLKQPKDKQDIVNAVEKLKTQFFNVQVVQQLCDLIINWYLLLKPSDLESWLLEPEEWCNEEFSSSWEYQIRPCAENFFQDLIKYFKDDLSEYLFNKISSNLLGANKNILVQDSILCCFQLSADSIADKVDFNQLLREVFIPLALRNEDVEDKIIKRRICLIISEWVKINCSKESRVEIYQLLLTFISANDKIHDQVVKLGATQCLRTIVDDWDFDKRDFSPFLTAYVDNLIQVLQQMNFTESKLYILQTLGVLVERCNPLISYETLMALLNIIPKYWEISNSANENILKNSLIRILKSLVIALNENSLATHSIALPMIRSCCMENSDNYQLLSEDAYDLWHSVLQFFPNSSSSESKSTVDELFEMVNFGLMNSTEVLQSILSIVRSYTLLSPEIFTNRSVTDLLRILSGYLNTMRDDSFDEFIALMDILFLQNSKNEAFLKAMIDSGLVNSMISIVLDENQSIVKANEILLVLSRLAYSSSDFFLEMLGYLSNNLSNFLTTWIKYYINNGSARNKKINLLAFLALLNTSIPKKNEFFIRLFPDVVNNVLLFLEEIQETSLEKVYNSSLIYDEHRYLDPDIKENGEKIRYISLLQRADPVFNVNLKAYLVESINLLKSSLSPQEFNELLSLLDEYSVEQLQKFAA
ncbi:hypothetical protein PSN45_001069 [Yamadazyma tenuis]|uniref:Importin N-terminal domain-containing protein n=1 Tax=Candida tenuis (strain ATCC 10573 / BCRC 21748 / CBS 615 / JCM 9827 / NBRC 10315 / NRRL Y-1498 / VKM Y-70) TaxID=590646 RepID=G3B830_CANTC|nr:uncharacterized protein CANTEDRAFT_126120 [Yamadazyma tenuis ATCC 10573]EGV62337.1 hypothetical protein CANTEDRAFT_126120 [Yamadazyma tenuis ATCC 10573]WEJ93601.1 hypothetical protein PSN45_001069 [Yamadazyma tenuis]